MDERRRFVHVPYDRRDDIPRRQTHDLSEAEMKKRGIKYKRTVTRERRIYTRRKK